MHNEQKAVQRSRAEECSEENGERPGLAIVTTQREHYIFGGRCDFIIRNQPSWSETFAKLIVDKIQATGS